MRMGNYLKDVYVSDPESFWGRPTYRFESRLWVPAGFQAGSHRTIAMKISFVVLERHFCRLIASTVSRIKNGAGDQS